MRVANAPCSWGVIERTRESERSYGYARVLDEMQATGYLGTELGDWGFMPTDPAQLRQALQQRGLSLVASWVPANLIEREGHAESAEQAVRAARLLASAGDERALIVIGDNLYAYPERNRVAGRVKPEDSMAEDQWRVFVDGVHHVARRVKQETGLRSVFHHHCSTWIEAPWEVEKLLDRTDPDLVGLCLDTGHYTYGGGNAVEGLQRHAGRVWHMHFKDCQPEIAAQARDEGWDYNLAVGEGLFCELGKGEVEFAAIVKLLDEIKYDGWIVVEQDVLPNMGTPKESARRNRAYLHSIGL